MSIYEKMTAELEAQKDRSAWSRGVKAYALELVEELEERAAYEGAETEQELASDRQPYKIMDGMQYLFASETDGYCLVVNGIEEREEGIVPEFILLGEYNVLKVVIESTGKRKMALQVLVDYIQVPVIVDGETYDTYYIETEKNISVTKQIKLGIDIDRNVDHKITVMLLNDLQLTSGEISGGEIAKYVIFGGAATFDSLLVCDKEKNELKRPKAEYETLIKEYDDELGAIFLTQDENGKRKKIQGNINVKPGEKVKLYYHIGGFNGETLIFLNIGEKQSQINGKDFLLFECRTSKVLYGQLEITAPMEEGKYEVGAWAVNNPYGKIQNGMQTIAGTPRFTLNVEK